MKCLQMASMYPLYPGRRPRLKRRRRPSRQPASQGAFFLKRWQEAGNQRGQNVDFRWFFQIGGTPFSWRRSPRPCPPRSLSCTAAMLRGSQDLQISLFAEGAKPRGRYWNMFMESTSRHLALITITLKTAYQFRIWRAIIDIAQC